MKLLQLTNSLVEEMVAFVADEVRKGTPTREIAATVEILLDREARKTINEGLEAEGRVFRSYSEAEEYLTGL